MGPVGRWSGAPPAVSEGIVRSPAEPGLPQEDSSMRKFWVQVKAHLANLTKVRLAGVWLLIAVRLLQAYAVISGHHC